MLTEVEARSAAACAHRLGAVAITSLQGMARTLLQLAERPTGNLEWLHGALQWLHSAARERVIAALVDTGAVRIDGTTVTIHPDLAAAVAAALETIAYGARQRGAATPAVYLSPPDLLAEIREDAGEIRQLLIELVSAARRHLCIVTPFFSEAALFEILAPLEVSSARPRLVLYLSAPAGDRQQCCHLHEALARRFSGHAVSLHLNERPADEVATIPHAKLLLCDSTVGYLGSANVSRHGLREQFEAGVRLDRHAVLALEQALQVLVRRGQYVLIGSPQPGPRVPL